MAFCACALRVPALARWVFPLVARLPSTRLLLRPSFRLVRCRGRASLSPKTTYRLLQYDDARAPTAGRRILDRGEWRRCYSPTFALCRPLRADASDEPRDPHTSEDAWAPWTGRPERRPACLSARKSPPRTDRAPHCRACERVKRTVVPLPHFSRAPGMTYRANAMRQPLRSSVPPLPAKGEAAVEDRGAFHRCALCRFRENCSSLFDQAGSLATRHRFTPKGSDALQQEVPAPL